MALNTLEQLIQSISRLPGLGKKSATRIAYALLAGDQGDAQRLATLIHTLHDTIRRCSVCGSYTETDPCPICTDSGRDRATICVVEQPQDVASLEASHEYHGLYHVLGGVIAPIDGIGPDDLAIRPLVDRAQQDGIDEVIIATNPTVEGDTTALFVARQLEAIGVNVSRLALGLPVGGDLEYADRLTLARSFRGRTPLA
ncbi:MAG: recombination mediator RecR [Spirochaeta sp.]|jgi:recombination protein RecR|nr:recombination mediator RecR [Spirochaeta sp.]